MPIYAYKCDSCGFAKDVLQRMSDAPIRECPSCQAQAFSKQVTAAGFQLKGSGWYATDFKGSAKNAASDAGDKSADAATAKTDAGAKSDSGGKTESKSTDSKPTDSKAATASAAKKPETPSTSGSGS